MIRNIVAAIAGIAVALLLVNGFEMFSHALFPPPENIEFGDPEQVRTFIESMPATAVLLVGAGWMAGAFVGTLLAAKISTLNPMVYAILVGGLILAGSITMLIIIPHPLWFTILAPIGVVAAAFLAMRLAGPAATGTDDLL